MPSSGARAAVTESSNPAILTHRGTRAVQRMVEYAPSTGGLALWAHHRDLPAEVPAPPVATDGRSIFYGAAFEDLTVELQAGWVAHEVLHIALRHAQRYTDLQRLLGDADLQLFNTCADAIVNSTLSHLGWLALPPKAVTLGELLARALQAPQTDEAALLEWDVERLYRAIDDRKGSGGKERSNAQRKDGPRSAVVRALGAQQAPDLHPGEDDAPQDEAEQAREWAERLVRAHAGDGAFSMLRTLLADVPRSRTPWEQALRTLLARALAPKRSLSWSRPARSWLANQGRDTAGRRMPWEPGSSAQQAVPRLAVIVDVSGSVDDALMQRFAREIEALTRRLEAGLTLIVGDDRVREVTRFEPGRSTLRDVRFQGGGGTDFTPMLQEADQHRPDITVVLTDLDGPADWQPRWPVVWAVPEAHADAPAPFGHKLILR
jgi:predicted metal-dependent peptidase